MMLEYAFYFLIGFSVLGVGLSLALNHALEEDHPLKEDRPLRITLPESWSAPIIIIIILTLLHLFSEGIS